MGATKIFLGNRFPTAGGGPRAFFEQLTYFLNDHPCISICGSIEEADICFSINHSLGVKNILKITLLKKPLIVRLDGRKKITFNKNNDGKAVGIYVYKLFHMRRFFEQILLIFFIVLSDGIIYQSQHCKRQWHRVVQITRKIRPKREEVIYNFQVELKDIPRLNFKYLEPQILIIKNEFQNDDFTKKLLIALDKHISQNNINIQQTINVFGNVPNNLICWIHKHCSAALATAFARSYALLHEEMLKFMSDNAGMCLIHMEALPACPNAVIEAQLRGIPVIGIDGGAMPEICYDPNLLLEFKDSVPLCERLPLALSKAQSYSGKQRELLSIWCEQKYGPSQAAAYARFFRDLSLSSDF